MLPSGNDAAQVLAEHFGQYLYEVATQNKKTNAKNGPGRIMSCLQGVSMEDQRIDWEKRQLPHIITINCFLQEMNRRARDFGLKNTNFTNAHGLGGVNNKSTAVDIGKLSFFSWKDA